MDKPVLNRFLIKKINPLLMLGLVAVVCGLSACSTSPVKTDEVAVTAKPETKPTADTKVVNKETKPKPVQVAKQQQRGKDKHHIEYDQKRLRYHQEWERQQVQQQAQVEERARQQWAEAKARQQWQVAGRSNQPYVDYSKQLSYAAIDRTRHHITYDGRYIPISYPNGDVPANIGVCTDTVIRSYRRLGIDLQRLVHEDISRAFYSYPNLPKWGLQAPDPNIDHRRVHNLKAFFTRHGQRLPITRNPLDYRPGDLVTWYLGGDQEHIGIVVDQRSPADPNRYMIVHNIGDGDKMEDALFKLPVTGHYRYFPQRSFPQPQLASAQY